MAETHVQTGQGPWFLADHPALDFINTDAITEGQPHDFWQTDQDVDAWLQQAGLRADGPEPEHEPGALVQAARQLRQLIREAVQQHKAGEGVDLQALNDWLGQTASYLQLSGEPGALTFRRIYPGQSVKQQLGKVAEQAAMLLTQEDFSRVRACEHPACALWFYDRTKAHRRRWCSMALCGNRAKVARFRAVKSKGE
ncbi:ABATE domain-containing protein [Pantoea sp. GD03673]|uniref:CGNR zinc finger domain-containing protein n=1 Tax=Pantoea sp. GD03673 TaxID=2975364 RepID=UPI0024483CA1|nr:ABATE domain-containing protein [Pantoea sp. GD03673]MDH2067030.1 ABATE domain-containing protein [Pantoea sp. GD03673]